MHGDVVRNPRSGCRFTASKTNGSTHQSRVEKDPPTGLFGTDSPWRIDVSLTAPESTRIMPHNGDSDAAYFVKAYATSGLIAPVIDCSFSGRQATFGATPFNSTYVAQKNFAPNSRSNDWGQTFVTYYQAANGNQGSSVTNSPLNLLDAHYNAGFVPWELVWRVLGDGGDLSDGTAVRTALLQDPTSPSIFGGSGPTPGRPCSRGQPTGWRTNRSASSESRTPRSSSSTRRTQMTDRSRLWPDG